MAFLTARRGKDPLFENFILRVDIIRQTRMSSYVERTVDDLALVGDEGRGKRRYARRSCKQAVIPGFPNGATPPESCQETRQRIK